jgi:transposase InsO family protein
VVHPLQALVTPYQPQHKLQWTDETIAAFEKIKSLINDCPTLSFLDESAPVFLHTDASDYGIGAYLFQLQNETEYPIAFISKSLNERERRWSTPEKECFAIYYSLIKLEYLVRDIHFTIRTDHRNLTYLNNSANAKVNRWKMSIQNFNFDIEYLEGSKNIVADGFSRLIDINNEHQVDNTDADDDEDIHFINSLANLHIKIPNDKYNKISAVHNSMAGHHGVEKTINKLVQTHQTWSRMRDDVKRFIKKCACCQKMSVLKIPIYSHPFTTAAYHPMERVNIDSIGPVDADDDGNCHIIVIIDCFTRFVELYPVKDTSALPAAIALLHHVGRYGCPSTILSDNGSQYVNEIITELLKLINTEHCKTMAYSKEENAIVERANKEVIRHLRAIIFDKNIVHNWSMCLPFVQRIINASLESSIGTTPASLLFGNSIQLDRGIFMPFPKIENNNFIALSNWSANLIAAQTSTIEAAQRHQLKKDLNHISNYNAKRTEFPIGSYVLMAYPTSNLKKGPPSKFNTNLKGPMKVVEFQGSKYIVKNLVTNRTENCHVSQLRTFYFDPDRLDPFDVAIRDQFATVVEKIISHTPIEINNNIKVSEMNFRVRWKNLTEDFDRILPWKELRNNPALHTYLALNKLYKLIPTEHKSEQLKELSKA